MSEIKECEFLEKEVDGCYLAGCIPKGYKTITNFKCKNNPNCYYKQLLAEQDKNKKLIEALEAISKAHSETTQRIMQYAQQALNEVNK